MESRSHPDIQLDAPKPTSAEKPKTGIRSYPRVYFEMLIVGFALIMCMNLPRSFLPLMARDLDPTMALVGFVTSAFYFARVFIEIPSGLIALKMGRRNLIIIGPIMAVVGAILNVLSRDIYMLIIGQAIWGCGAALFFVCNTALILDLFPAETRGQALGTFQSIEFIGNFVGSPLGAFMAVSLGYNNVFILVAVILSVAFIVAITSRSLKTADTQHQSAHKPMPIKDAVGSLQNKGLLVTSYVNLCRVLVTQGVMQTVIQLYLKDQIHVGLELIGVLLGLKTAGMIAGTLLSGSLTAKVGPKRLVMVGLLIDGISLYFHVATTNFWWLLVPATIEGFGTGICSTSLIILMSEQVPASIRSGAVGVFRTFMDVGGILGPIIFMIAYNSVGFTSPFWMAALLTLSNIVTIQLIKKKKDKEN